MQRLTSLLSALMVFLVLAACEPWPRDPESTTEMVVESGRLRVGVIHNPPWTDLRDDRPQGREVRLITAFAGTLDATPDWRAYGTHEGFAALEQGEIDLLAGGLVKDTPYRKATFTRPFELSRSDDGKKRKHVLAVRRGENHFLVMLERYLAAHPGPAE